MTAGGSALSGRRLILYADVSSTIGTGHVMRLLALGQAWLDRGGRVIAIAPGAPRPISERLRAEGFEVPATDQGVGPVNLAPIHVALASEPQARVAIDSPLLDDGHLRDIEGFADRALLVDDMGLLAAYPIRWVLNQNAHADRALYPTGGRTEYLLGLTYAILRREFRQARPGRRTPGRARRLLVTAGGADPAGLTQRVIDALGMLPAAARIGLEVQVVVGAANPAAGEIARAADRSDVSITLVRGVQDMADRMAWADLAVTAGGSTVWELARSGCPALVVETSPPERMLVAGLERVGLFDRLGPVEQLDSRAAADAIARRIDDATWRTSMAALGPSLVDGAGPDRVIAALVDGGG